MKYLLVNYPTKSIFAGEKEVNLLQYSIEGQMSKGHGQVVRILASRSKFLEFKGHQLSYEEVIDKISLLTDSVYPLLIGIWWKQTCLCGKILPLCIYVLVLYSPQIKCELTIRDHCLFALFYIYSTCCKMYIASCYNR